MANVKIINNQKSKRALKLKDCLIGDIVFIPSDDIYCIITDGEAQSGDRVVVIDITTGEMADFEEETVCSKYIGKIEINSTEFLEFIE